MSKPQATPEVLRSYTASLLATLAVCTGGCLSPNGGEMTTNVNLSSETGGVDASSGSGSGSTFNEIMTTTEDPDTTPHSESSHSDSADTTGVSSDTTGVVVGCGDGVLDTMTEECDFGTGNADDAACTADCKMARCGDKLVQKGVEKCDDGLNDGAYGGCATDCTALAPFCGDGQVQEAYEACDEADTKNGCIASTCKWAKSCKEIREGLPDDPEVTDGVYSIKPLDEKIKVLCDMDADGGGYTFLKVALQEPGAKYNAAQAEAECKKYGMQLFVPRSEAHAIAAVMMAKSTALVPVGTGAVKSNLDYLRILGIYPVMESKSCTGAPLNSQDCPEWKAAGTKYWVTDMPVPGLPGTKNCVKCSNAYYWKDDGTLDFYETPYLDGLGADTYRFMCDVGDKLPI